jgi:cobalt-zinc-cadmium efflux system protein
MLYASVGLLRASVRVMMEAAPAGLEPDEIGRVLARQSGVAEVHDLHVWEVTSGFPALSAHIVVDAGEDCHEVRRALSRLLADRYKLAHSTLQVEHARRNRRSKSSSSSRSAGRRGHRQPVRPVQPSIFGARISQQFTSVRPRIFAAPSPRKRD